MRGLRRELPFFALLALAVPMLLVQLKSPASLYDEGLVLLAAERIRHGEIPYRDFWTLYAPGYYYVVAALFSVVEPTVLAARWLDSLLRMALVVVAYLLARSLTSRWVAVVPAACIAFWLGTIGFYSSPAFPATAAILATNLVLAHAFRVRDERWLWVAGLGLGITAIVRLDFGGFATVGAVAAVAIAGWREGVQGGAPLPTRIRQVVWPVARLAGGALLVALPAYLPLIRVAGLPTLLDQLVLFPATVFRAVRHLPLPSPIPTFVITSQRWTEWVWLYLPAMVYATALVVTLRWLVVVASTDDDRFRIAVTCLALTGAGLGLWIKATTRFHDVEVLPTTICAAIVGTALVHRIPRRIRRSLPFGLAFAVAAALLLVRPYLVHFASVVASDPTSPLACYSELPRAGCVRTSPNQTRMVEYVRAHTAPGETVFFGNARHDLIFINDLLAYFLADRPSPTRYAELHPGLATTVPVQQAIVADLAEKDVRWVVTRRGFESKEPNASGVSSDVTLLDDYIRTHYRPETTFGPYQVWQRRPSRADAEGASTVSTTPSRP